MEDPAELMPRAARGLAALLLALPLAAIAAAPAPPTGETWLAGDLIFREGTALVSEAVRGVDPGGYSHVGLLDGAPGDWRVLHAEPAETPGDPDGVREDPLAFFLAPQRARAWAVYRVEPADPAQRAAAIAAIRARLGEPFRLAPGPGEPGTYCTVLITEAYAAAGVKIGARSRHLGLPLIAGEYLLPSGLREAPTMRRVEASTVSPHEGRRAPR